MLIDLSISPIFSLALRSTDADRRIIDDSGQITPEQAWILLPLLSNRDDDKITAYVDDVQLSSISPDLILEKDVLRYVLPLTTSLWICSTPHTVLIGPASK